MASLNQFIFHEDDFKKAYIHMLEAVWPVEPTRMIRLTLNNMKLRTAQDTTEPILGDDSDG